MKAMSMIDNSNATRLVNSLNPEYNNVPKSWLLHLFDQSISSSEDNSVDNESINEEICIGDSRTSAVTTICAIDCENPKNNSFDAFGNQDYNSDNDDVLEIIRKK